MALMQSGAVDAVAGALTASIMNERVVQHDLQAVVPFVTREADRAVTPRWVQLSAQCPGARTWWRVRGFKGSRVRGFEGSRVRGFEGSRVRGLVEVTMARVLAPARWVHRKRGSTCMIR